jgi:quaternary ammonium compound-resistance protein SugE
MAWIYVVLAGLLEVCWAVGLKYTDGFSRLWPSLFVAVTLAGSMLLLALAVRTLPIGTAYAVWVGIGVLGASALGILLFHEPLTWARAFFLLLLVAAIIGLKATTPPDRSPDEPPVVPRAPLPAQD